MRKLTKLLIMLSVLTLLFTACPMPEPPLPPEPTPEPTPEEPEVIIDEKTNDELTSEPAAWTQISLMGIDYSQNVIFALYDNNNVEIFDGLGSDVLTSGNCKYAGNRAIAVDDEIRYYDSKGVQTGFDVLPVVPDYIRLMDNRDIYIVEKLDPQESYALGAQARNHTRIWKNGVELGQWYLNQYEASGLIVSMNNEVFVCSGNGFMQVETNYTNVIDVVEGGPVISDYDVTAKTAYINSNFYSFESGYFFAGELANHGDIWYSSTGYTWNSLTLDLGKLCTAMCVMNDRNLYPYANPNNENAYMEWVCTRGDSIYWIDHVTGTFMQFKPEIDLLSVIGKLYHGDNHRTTAVATKAQFKPVLIGDMLYFHYSGSLIQYDFTTGVRTNFRDDCEVWVW